MMLPLTAAVASVLAGAGLALIPGLGRSAIGRIRTFASMAAITVVLAHPLPEASPGPRALKSLCAAMAPTPSLGLGLGLA